jgi:DNA-binding CsgD family transcriptional regulator
VRLATRTPVLIFDVSAREPTAGLRAARPAEVRLVGSIPGDAEGAPTDDTAYAVLLLHAPSPSRLLGCVRAITRDGGLSAALPMPEPNAAEASEIEAPPLTRREEDVLRLLADGGTTRDIAQHLSYSERTVKNIVRSVLDKLGCRTRAHAVALAARHGVV